jgi:hypothetical protein
MKKKKEITSKKNSHRKKSLNRVLSFIGLSRTVFSLTPPYPHLLFFLLKCQTTTGKKKILWLYLCSYFVVGKPFVL